MFRNSVRWLVLRSLLLVLLIAVADWQIDAAIPLGFMYLLPMSQLGRVLNRWQMCLAALLCTVLTEAFNGLKWTPVVGLPRDILTFAAFASLGLFVYGVVRGRKAAAEHMREIESQIEARRDAESQLEVLVESSPLAIFTADERGQIQLANDAANRLFGVAEGHLAGRSVHEYLPSLVHLPAARQAGRTFRTAMQCHALRSGGEVFLADLWFSTYRTNAGSRLAAMVVDTSEELRTREESSLHQLLAGSRLVMAGVSHEIRNICAAIAVVHQNLRRSRNEEMADDFDALKTLVESLQKMAIVDLRRNDLRRSTDRATSVDLHSLLEELRIVVEPTLEESGVALRIVEGGDLPPVLADRSSLMQVFLNLIKNSERAMQDQEVRQLNIRLETFHESVVLHFADTGMGVAEPEELFKPFQQKAAATGLGLYLSQAFVRSFHGELRYEPTDSGASFAVELRVWKE
jgi:two-component system sensor kinase FixL